MPLNNGRVYQFLDADAYDTKHYVDGMCEKILGVIKSRNFGYQLVCTRPTIIIFDFYVDEHCRVVYNNSFENYYRLTFYEESKNLFFHIFDDYFSDSRENLEKALMKEVYNIMNPLDISLDELQKLDVESLEFGKFTLPSHETYTVLDKKYFDLDDFLNKVATAIISKPNFKKHCVENLKDGYMYFNVLVNGKIKVGICLPYNDSPPQYFAHFKLSSGLLYQSDMFCCFDSNGNSINLNDL